MELAGRKIVGPDAVGEALRGLVKTAKEEVRTASRMIRTDRRPVWRLRPRHPRGPWRRDTQPVFGGTLPVQRRTLSNGPPWWPPCWGALESVGKHHADAEISWKPAATAGRPPAGTGPILRA